MTRRGRGQGAVYFEHKSQTECKDERHHRGCTGKWRVEITADVNGKRVRRRVNARTKTDAYAKLRELQDELGQGVHSSASYTVQDAVDAWLAEAMAGRAEKTLQTQYLESSQYTARHRSGDAAYSTELLHYNQYCPVLGGYYHYSMPYQWIYLSDNIYHPAHVGSYNPNACGEELANTKASVNQSVAKTIDSAFNVLGFAGSSQTGYTTSAQINLYFGEHGYDCGTELYPHAGFDYPVQIP